MGLRRAGHVLTDGGRRGRRPSRAALALGTTLLLVAGLDGSRAEEAGPSAHPAGYGLSTARVLRFDPSAAGFSFGAEIASARARHQVTAARADLRSIDPGTLGVALAGEGCEGEAPPWPREQQPQPLRLDSRDEGADRGRSDRELGFTREARATAAPWATGTVRLDPIRLPGALELRGLASTASSGHRGDGVRQADARVSIASLSIAGGLVVIEEAEWAVRHRSGAEEEVDAGFTIGGARIAGVPVRPGDLDELPALVDDVLATLGLSLELPTVRHGGGTAFVEPLRVAVVPSAARDRLASLVLTAVQPLRDVIVELLLEASCGSGAALTVADLLVGSLTGAGSFTVELGGVSATTRAVELEHTLGTGEDRPPPPEAALAPTTAPPTPSTGPAPTSTTGPGPSGTVAAGAAPARSEPAPAARARDLAAVVGAGVLLLGALLAEGDRRRMQRAQARAEAPGPATGAGSGRR